MSPTYHNMDLVILSKFSKSFEPGDVIAFQCKALRSVLVKRVVACPGDTVQIREGTLYVNEHESTVYPSEVYFQDAGLLSEMITLGQTEYAVIGDNIELSRDSRDASVGIVFQSDILGSVVSS